MIRSACSSGRWAWWLVALGWACGCGASRSGLAGGSRPEGVSPGVAAAAASRAPTVPSTGSARAPASVGEATRETGASEVPPAAPLPPRAPLEAADLPPAGGRFVRIDLPEGPEIRSITGRGARQLWLLNGANDLYRYDGRTARLAHAALCWDHEYEPGEAPMLDHQSALQHVALVAGDLVAVGPSPGPNEMGSIHVWIRSGRVGDCHYESGEPRAFVYGERSAWLASYIGHAAQGRLLAIAGRPAPAPHLEPGYFGAESTPIEHLWMTSDDDVWAVGPRIWQYQGLGWQDRGASRLHLLDLWADERGHAWLLGTPERRDDLLDGSEWRASLPSTETAPEAWVERFDGTRWRGWPVPRGFAATIVYGTAPDDVWFFGGPRAFQWDGQILRQTPMPLDGVTSVWSDGRELWVAGHVNETWSRRPPSPRQPVNLGVRRGALARLVRSKQGKAP